MGMNMAKMQDIEEASRRVLVWFSAGAASAVALKIAKDTYGDVLAVYLDTHSEHPDNKRFILDVEKWLGVHVACSSSGEYRDIWDVFERTRWLVGPAGARCTTELKKKVRHLIEMPGDLQVYGYTVEEKERLARFEKNNPEINIWCPLIERGISKADCLDIIHQAGIELPTMYKLGFRNNNCIGCVKGGQKYWARTRKHFPEVFERMARLERELDVAINKTYAGDGERKRLFLDELPDDISITEPETSISCGLFCGGLID